MDCLVHMSNGLSKQLVHMGLAKLYSHIKIKVHMRYVLLDWWINDINNLNYLLAELMVLSYNLRAVLNSELYIYIDQIYVIK